MAARWTTERVRELFAARGCEMLDEEYRGYSVPIRYRAKCGHERTTLMSNFTQGKGDLCRECRYVDNGRKESVSEERIRGLLEKSGCSLIAIDRTARPLRVRYIASCGHENEMAFQHFASGGGRLCSSCSHSVRYQLDYVREVFEAAGCVLLETEYINCKTPMRYIAECGHEAVITFDSFLSPNATHRCRDCHKHTYHEEVIERNLKQMKRWRKAVYVRDGYACVACGHHGGDLNAHHLDSYDICEKKRLAVDNGVTLCPACHIAFHRQYGFGGTTAEQFEEWLREYRGNSQVNNCEHRNA